MHRLSDPWTQIKAALLARGCLQRKPPDQRLSFQEVWTADLRKSSALEGRGMTIQLGQLKRLDPRTAWKFERGFSLWLKENVHVLAEELGIEIEFGPELTQGLEVSVGDFVVDLRGTETGTSRQVIIENQLGDTNHAHLGALLTYAAGLDAGIIVWIATRFRDEHREALDWLNTHTDENLDFFGVELELFAINDGPPAPHFKMVAQPNEWTKATRKAAVGKEPTARELKYKSFFEDVLKLAKEKRPDLTTSSRVSTNNYMLITGGASGIGLVWVFKADDRFGVELSIETSDRDQNKRLFDSLAARSTDIEASLTCDLMWDRLEHAKRSVVGVYRGGSIDGMDEELQDLKVWGVETMIRFADVFRPRFRKQAAAVPPRTASA